MFNWFSDVIFGYIDNIVSFRYTSLAWVNGEGMGGPKVEMAPTSQFYGDSLANIAEHFQYSKRNLCYANMRFSVMFSFMIAQMGSA